MSEIPNPADFSVNEKEGEYTVRINVRGSISLSIKAASKEDAEREARSEVAKMWDEGYVEIDDIEDCEVSSVLKDRPMYRVIREGEHMQVSHLQAGDTPRQPNEYGF